MTMRYLQITAILMSLGIVAFAEAKHGLVAFQAYYPLESTSLSFELPSQVVRRISTVEEWKRLWVDIESRSSVEDPATPPEANALPSIDFNRYTVLVVALGARPTGGYSVVFHSVREHGSGIDVVAYELRPRGNCVVTATITYPVAFALIPATDKPVRFSIEHADKVCGE